MTSCGWLWIYAGALLMLSELLAPGFVICFFGLSAATVGLVRLAIGPAFSPAWQLAAFSLFAIVYLLTLRRWLKHVFTGETAQSKVDFSNESVGRLGKVTEAIEPPRAGRVLIGDAAWTAEATEPLPVGTDVRVVSQCNLTMKVKKI